MITILFMEICQIQINFMGELQELMFTYKTYLLLIVYVMIGTASWRTYQTYKPDFGLL